MREIVHITAINASKGRVEEQLPRHLLNSLDNAFAYQMENFSIIKKKHPKKFGNWDGMFHPFSKKNQTFDAGLHDIVEEILKRAGYHVDNEFRSIVEMDIPFDPDDCTFSYRSYQHAAVEWALQEKRGIILSSTSSGKTLVAYGITKSLLKKSLRVLYVVPRVNLVDQLRRDFEKYSGGSWDGEGFLVSTWQSLQHKDDSFFEDFDAVIVDEVHLSTAKELKRIVMACVNAYIRIGMTGTIDNDRRKKILYRSLFGPFRRFTSNKDLIEMGFAPNIHVRFVNIEHKGYKSVRSYAAEMQWLEDSICRNQVIAEKVVSNEGNAFVMVKKRKHARLLAKRIKALAPERKVVVMDGETDKETRNAVFEAFDKRDDIVLVATYSLISTGLSINNVKFLHMAAPLKSFTTHMQSIGRIMRQAKGKDVGVVYDYVDVSPHVQMYAEKHGMVRIGHIIEEEFPFEEEEVSCEDH